MTQGAHRDVGIHAEAAFLHVAIAHSQPRHQGVEGAGIGHGFGSGAHIRLGDDFEQRRTGTIQVDAGHALEVFVQAFAGIFFKVGAGELDSFYGIAHDDIDVPAFDNRQLKLADLVAFGQVGVKVIFAGKNRGAVDMGIDRQAKADGFFDGGAVHHRQDTRQGNIHRAGLGIRRGTKGGAAAGKNL